MLIKLRHRESMLLSRSRCDTVDQVSLQFAPRVSADSNPDTAGVGFVHYLETLFFGTFAMSETVSDYVCRGCELHLDSTPL